MSGRTHPELGVDYFDGLGASGMVADQVDDFRGGPLSDGIPVQELNKMVFELVPGMKQTRPTQFLNWFHAQMQQSGNRWLLKAYYSDSPAPIEFDSVLQDEDGHAFILPFSANAQFYRLATLREGEERQDELKHRHIFARLARWLLPARLVLLELPQIVSKWCCCVAQALLTTNSTCWPNKCVFSFSSSYIGSILRVQPGMLDPLV
ncbi:unnamed protein product [Effrenium voratum]|nr:unnamed protein product [Effrenium voratum]